MIITTIIYLFCIFFSIHAGYKILKKNKDLFSIFFFIFTISAGIWFILYYLYFCGINNAEFLLRETRLSFSIGLITTYSLLLSLILYNKKIKSNSLIIYGVSFFYLSIIFFINFTPYIIKGLEFIEDKGVYREIYGKYYLLYFGLQIVFIMLFISIGFIKKPIESGINKIRFKYLYISSYLFLFSLLLLQVIFPYFKIWILEQQVIIIYGLYIYSISIILKKYYQIDFYYSLGQIIVIVVSFLLSYYITDFFIYINSIIKSNYLDIINNKILYNTLLICLFIISYKILYLFLVGNNQKNFLVEKFGEIEHKISNIIDLNKINKIIEENFNYYFKNKGVKIIKINKKNSEYKNLFNNNQQFIINDKVYYIEHGINYDKIKNIINPKYGLIFPIYDDNNKLSYLLLIGKKILDGEFKNYEIDSIKKFSFFLQNHIKYIENYNKLQLLTLSLDKEVDKKTIEYNNLINKQKEYIGIISHELKSPISSAIFQADYLLDEAKKQKNDEMIEEVSLLNEVLVRIGELTSKLFNSEYLDKGNINLYLEKVNLANLLNKELNYYRELNPKINFINNISKDRLYYKIDKVQFKQVIQNIISNSLKFTNKDNGIIAISMRKNNNFIEIYIEDNGVGLKGVNTKEIFDRYSTSKDKNIGLGMGLFLCKRIVELHGGKIYAENSKKYGGARFRIKLNIKNLG